MYSWHQISRIHKHVLVLRLIIEILKILWRRVFNVHIGKLVFKALIVQKLLPIADFLKDAGCFEGSNFIFVREFDDASFDFLRIGSILDEIT